MNNEARVQDARVDSAGGLEYRGEAWTPILDFPNYWISNHGRVLSLLNNRIRKGVPDKNGYLRITIYNKSGRHTKTIHRLVAQAFIPNPCNYPEINHIDEVRDNPYFKNLEWVTSQMNNEQSKALHYTFRSPEGKKVEVYNLNQFSKDKNLQQAAMHRIYQGKSSNHKAWSLWKPGDVEGVKFKVKPTNVTYRFISPDGNLTEVNNLSKFAKENGLSRSNLSKVHAGKQPYHKGWTKA